MQQLTGTLFIIKIGNFWPLPNISFLKILLDSNCVLSDLKFQIMAGKKTKKRKSVHDFHVHIIGRYDVFLIVQHYR